MSIRAKLLNSVSVLIISGLSTGVVAADLDMETQNLLINKFSNVLKKMPPGSDAREGVLLRLADLYAERGRILSNQQIDSGCIENCISGKEDRVEALKLYKQALKTLDSQKSGKVLTQVGHLHEVMGQQLEAQKFYQTVLNSNVEPESKAEVFFSLGEIDFKAFKFESAVKNFENALKIESFGRKGVAYYRSAWAFHNMGKTEKGISFLRKIISDPNLLKRGGETIGSIDHQFRSEVVHDLAIFLVKTQEGLVVAKEIFELTEENSKVREILFIAKEFERLGKILSAIEVYKFVYDNQADVVGRVETLVHLSQLQLNLKNRKESLANYELALEQWKGIENCDKQLCSELKSRIRKYILEWHRVEKSSPSLDLLASYQKYIEVFSSEVDMRVWISEIYKAHKNYSSALAEYSKIESLIKNKKDESTPDGLSMEKVLLAQLELSELLGTPEARISGYTHYLLASTERTQADQVKYQMAHLRYTLGNYIEAINIFEEILTSSKDNGLKIKSADLIMDALVILKDEAKIYSMAKKLSLALPSKAKEFESIASKSKLNVAASMGDAAPLEAWNQLLMVNAEALSQAEKVTFYKNKLILAEKLKMVEAAELAISSLLAIGDLAEEDREYALSRRAWLAELKLDFKTAYSSSKELKMSALNPAEKTMRLALLADLAGENSNRYYKQYLDLNEADASTRVAIVSELVRRASRPSVELKKYRSEFVNHKNIYAQLLQEIYFSSEKITNRSILEDKWLEGTDLELLVWQKEFFTSFDSDAVKVKEQALNSSSQRALATSLKSRVDQLSKIEKKLEQAIVKKDWATQLASLKLLGDEELRFYNEILALPVPAGLSDIETNQYLSLLSEQASPHKNKSDILLSKYKEMIAAEGLELKFKTAYEAASTEMRSELKKSIERIATNLVTPQRESFLAILDYVPPSVAKMDIQQIEAAKNRVRLEPFSREAVVDLLNIEVQAGNEKMIQYLKERLSRAPAQVHQEKGDTNVQ